MSRFLLAGFAALALAIAPPFARADGVPYTVDVKVDGDSVATAKLVLVESRASDRTTARGAAECALGLFSFFQAVADRTPAARAVVQRWEAMFDPSRQTLAERLLSPAYREAMNATRAKMAADEKERDDQATASGMTPTTRHPWTFTEEAGEGGLVIVTAESTVDRAAQQRGTPAWKMATESERWRLTCQVGDDKLWQVKGAEKWGYNKKWSEETPLSVLFMMFETNDPGPMPAAESAEDTARAALNWLPAAHRQVPAAFIAPLLPQYWAKVDAMFSTAHVAAVKSKGEAFVKSNAEQRAKLAQRRAERAIESTKALEDGSTEVVFSGLGSGPKVRVVLTRSEQGWRVESADVVRAPKGGDGSETREPVTSIEVLGRS